MAHSAHTDPEQIKERYDDPEVLERKLDKLAKLVRGSKHFVIFTGAGISTDAGIPDFRGPDGVWTLKAQGRTRQGRTVSTLSAIPTVTHMSIVSLLNRGICKYLISQNCDGLHRRSGVPPDLISELHGNGNIEYCEDCGYEYLRDYHCTRVRPGSDHYTGRHCCVPISDQKVCGGRLMNSTIDFGQNLPAVPMNKGFENSKNADLHLVLGSSLTVSPACNMPLMTARVGGKLVICNLQNTPLDDEANMHIYARCDTIMKGLMDRLDIEIPSWSLRRMITCRVSKSGDSHVSIAFGALELGTKGQAIPASVIKYVEIVSFSANGQGKGDVASIEPFEFSIPKDSLNVKSRIHFMGHYKEPFLDLKIDISAGGTQTYMWMEYDPYRRQWSLTRAARMHTHAKESLLIQIPNENEGTPVSSAGLLLSDAEKCYEDVEYADLFGECSLSLKSIFCSSCPYLSRVLSLTPQNKRKDSKAFGKREEGEGEEEGVVFGFNADEKAMTFLRVFGNDWITRPCKHDALPTLLSRSGFASFQVPDTFFDIYIFGGTDGQQSRNDLFVLNRITKNLTAIVTEGTPPTPRSFHSATPVSQSVVVFGGCHISGNKTELLNDCYAFHLSRRVWRKLTIAGIPPSPRASHSAILVDHRTIAIFGGFDGKSFLTDIHLFDLVEMKWREIEPPGGSPPPPLLTSTYDQKYLTLTTSPSKDSWINGQNAEPLIGPHLLVFPSHLPSVCYALHLVHWKWSTLSFPFLSSFQSLECVAEFGKGQMFVMGKKKREAKEEANKGEGEKKECKEKEEKREGLYGVVTFEIVKK